MIDLHCHVLPDLDDGARDVDEAVRLAAAIAADGVRTLAATPHLRADHPKVDPASLANRVAELQGELDRTGIALELVPGGEVDMAWAYRASDAQLRQVSYGQRGRDLLLETPYGHLPPAFEGVVASLRERGYRVLLAHPERCRTFDHEPERLTGLVRGGVLVQVGADSFTELPKRSRTRRLAARLVSEGLAHVLASDSHGMAADRSPRLSKAVAVVERLAPERGVWMVTDAPAAVLAGQALPRRAQRRVPLAQR